MKRLRSFLMAAVLSAAMSGAACSEDLVHECEGTDVEKIEGPGVWQPGPDGIQTPLWPDHVTIKAPETRGHTEWIGNGSPLVAGRTWNWATYVSQPTMTVYAPKGANTRASILVLPGGGYAAVAMDLEGTEICDWITKRGITCVLLKYRVPIIWRRDENGIGHPPADFLPLEDAQRAIGLMRERASSLDIDPAKIGVIGFSAGAHLAAAVSNADARTYDLVDDADTQSLRPDFAILLYPGRLWDRTSLENGLKLAPWIKISAKAPPTLLIHAMNDPVNDVRHSMTYGLALKEAGVPVELRIFDKGCHAFGLRATSDPVTTEWPNLVLQWLSGLGVR